ncbi:SRPBCC family protein [Tabrizicola sp.]|uniref:SRPBCC family protein n=1 Tax=Tabrizicola sp. TaxID=2005166 RepID=UPI00286D6187|nr:SRPBCC family protein [Tabrizicola sp.]
MKLTAKCDVDAPLAFVFQTITDFPAWEQAAARGGAEVDRIAGKPAAGVGTEWNLRFVFRGKGRKATVRVIGLLQDQKIEFDLDGKSLAGLSAIEVQPLSARRTRIKIGLTIKPKTLAARLFVNTLRLTKGRITTRYEMRVGQLGAEIEDRYMRHQLEAKKG